MLTPCCGPVAVLCIGGTYCFHFRDWALNPQDGGSILPRNVGTDTTDYYSVITHITQKTTV